MRARAKKGNDPKPFPTTEVGRRALNAAVRPGLTFSEVMTGMITKGSTDPIEGYENEAAVAMSLTAVVDIANLPALLRDPHHRGRWAAAGELPVWGGPITSGADGDFRLFRRTVGQNGKPVREMVYDTFVTVGGQTYLLRGFKVIEPGPLWRAWTATTTMYVRFFDLGNTAGPPVAAGILRLSLGGFLRQLTTMRVTGGLSLVDELHFLGLFFRFFAGSLVRTYLLRRRW
ncbi:hypothetical protein [Mycobacterium sp.]|uniref:hypothetical protein n=1 Tax=Mycobacterium sp. TaxID=1785 RepID=UPI00122AF81C|nr:hypothetical protein [Mycobacterium sp.]TAM64726.1 MAG: hypothetical protein EPN51_23060 [Mycobacterium sp.]